MPLFSWRAPASLAVLLSLLSMVLAAPPAVGQADQPSGHLPPVVAPIVDGFRPPATPFGPGNRGLEYDTTPGDPVHASAAGEVVFAGEVAGSRHVTVLHDDGVRTSCAYLQDVGVVLGQRVEQGQRLGTAGDVFHFGARRGDSYFDPALLFARDGPDDVEVELLPFEVPPGSRPDAERLALAQLLFDRWGPGGGVAVDLGAVGSWFSERTVLIHHYLTQLHPQAPRFGEIDELARKLAQPTACSDEPAPLRPVAGQPRAALLVGGLGSSVEAASVNDLRVDDLGYAPGATRRLDYDSEGDLPIAAKRLADEVERLAAENPPGTKLDLYGHSMGGLVIRRGLMLLERRGFDFEQLGLVATFGSPHQGADLATAAVSSGFWSDVPAVAQMAETAPRMRDVARSELPPDVRLLSLAASGDVVVAAPRTVVPGATNVTVTLHGLEAHGDLVANDEATAEVARALAGQAPACEAVWEIVQEHLTGEMLSSVSDVAGFALVPSGG